MAKRKKYRLLAGTHNEGGTTYKSGAVIESDHDLVSLFGANRFMLERKFVEEPEDDEPEESSAESSAEDKRGDDVSTEFESADDADLTVFKKNGKWFLYDDEKLVASNLKKGDVDSAVYKYLDEIENSSDE